MKLNKKKFILALAVFNSYSNLENILFNIKNSSFNKLIKEIVIVDNDSNLLKKDKIKKIKSLSKKFHKKIHLIINSKNYGLGGSQKILFNYLNKKKFDFFINAHTTGRYKILNQLKFLNKIQNYEYILASRFLNKDNTKSYSILRKVGNIFFQKFTTFVSTNKLSDPGSAIYIMKKDLLKKIFYESKSLTDYSHFNHLLNILVQTKTNKYFEYPIKWKDGNIKSHLNPTKYIFVLSFSLIKFYFFKTFFKQKKVKFTYEEYDFK